MSAALVYFGALYALALVLSVLDAWRAERGE